MANDETNIIIYQADRKHAVKLLARDGKIWLTQAQIADLFGTSKQNVSAHINNILKEKELDVDSNVKFYLTLLSTGRNAEVKYYSLEMILAVGFRVRSVRGVLFRQWANQHLREYLVKGFVIDDERLKNPDGRPDYFDELLQRIRDIRASEKRFYQKVRDLLALSSDYDKSDKGTQMFFAEVQNKLLYAVTERTAAQIVLERADVDANNMGLTSWQGNRVRKQDVIVAKNYLRQDEIDKLNRLVVAFLDQAELRVLSRRDLTLSFWRENVDRFIEFNDKPVLAGKGTVSHEQMEQIVKKRYELFDARRKRYEAEQADAEDVKELKELEDEIKRKKGK